MKKVSLVTGSPIFKPELALFDHFVFDRHSLFSYARYGFIYLFQYLQSRKKGHPKRLLFPSYMCHEVTTSLRDFGFEIEFYAVDENFNIQIPNLQSKLSGSSQDILGCVVFHAYGHVGRGLGEVQELCDGYGIPIIEDCAHVPFPHLLETDLRSLYRVYTLRKTYPLPYGAVVVGGGAAPAFSDYMKSLPETRKGAFQHLVRWTAREQIKRMVLACSIPVRRKYSDLSIDPLKGFNQPSRLFNMFLRKTEVETVVQRRRENLKAYQRLRSLFAGWARPFEFDAQVDIPYQYLLVLREDLKPEEVVESFLKRGVSAVIGLALENRFLSSLPPNHAFRRLVALPIHQGLTASQFEKIEDSSKALLTLYSSSSSVTKEPRSREAN